MSTRKIVLLSLIIVLLGIYTTQIISDGRNTVKELIVTEDIDQLRITKNGEKTIIIAKDGEEWFVRKDNETPFAADDSAIQQACNTVKTIRVLETVSRLSDTERFGLTDASTTVEVLAKGKTVRSLILGKRAETQQQSYVKIDGSNAICLVAGTPSLDLEKDFETWLKKAEPARSTDDENNASSGESSEDGTGDVL